MRKSNNNKNNKKAILILDVLLFESITNESLVKLFKREEYFILLWTVNIVDYLHSIPYDGHICGLRNGFKPYRYLRMHLRQHHPDVLCLPTVIVDFEKNFNNSRFGYDKCINICEWVIKRSYNNRDVNIIDTMGMFTQIEMFVQQYDKTTTATTSLISQDDIISKSIVLSSQDLLRQQQQHNPKKRPLPIEGKQRIVNKQFILIIGSSFFTHNYNVSCEQFKQFLLSSYLVVWMNNKNTNTTQIRNFQATLELNGINVNYMLFGLDRNVKSISYVRKSLAPTKLPFILVDTLSNIYDNSNNNNRSDDDIQLAVCDFDLYININEYFCLSDKTYFLNMSAIFSRILNFVQNLMNRRQQGRSIEKLKIVECFDEDEDDERDDYDQRFCPSGIVTENDDEWKNRINRNEYSRLPSLPPPPPEKRRKFK